MGLRERKKLATREALARAALRLALERGLRNVRVEDIAAEAGVSPRTYNNYFSSREQAICFLAVQRAERVGAALQARPADEPLDEAIFQAMTEVYAGHGEPDRMAMRMLGSDPAIRGEYLKSFEVIEGPLAEAIAARTGTDASRDLFPRALAAAAIGAARAAGRQYAGPAQRASYTTLLREALTVITPAARAHQARGG